MKADLLGGDPPNLFNGLTTTLVSYRDGASVPVDLDPEIASTSVRDRQFKGGEALVVRLLGCVRPRLDQHFGNRTGTTATAITSKKADESQQ